MIDVLLCNASVQDGTGVQDFAVDQGKLVARGVKLDYPAVLKIDLQGRLLIPGFVESHVHQP